MGILIIIKIGTKSFCEISVADEKSKLIITATTKTSKIKFKVIINAVSNALLKVPASLTTRLGEM